MCEPAGGLSVFMILGQSGTALTAWLSFEYEWKYVYYFMMGILLVSILIIFITMPNYKFLGAFLSTSVSSVMSLPSVFR